MEQAMNHNIRSAPRARTRLILHIVLVLLFLGQGVSVVFAQAPVGGRIIISDAFTTRIVQASSGSEQTSFSTAGQARVVTTADRIIISDADRTRFFDPSSGGVKSYLTDGQASVVTTADRIIISDAFTTLILNGSSGNLIRSYDTAGQARVVTTTDRIIMSDAFVTRIVDASSGNELPPSPYSTAGQARVVTTADRIMISDAFVTRILFASSGSEQTSFSTAGQARVVTGADRIIISDANSTRIFDPSSGILRFNLPTAGQARVVTTARRIMISDPFITRIFNPLSNSLIGSYTTAGQASVVATAELIMIGDPFKTQIVNASTGGLIASYNTTDQDAVAASVVTTTNRVIISDGNRTRILNGSSGNLIRTYDTAGQANVVTTTDRIIISDGIRTRIIDASSGNELPPSPYSTAGQARVVTTTSRIIISDGVRTRIVEASSGNVVDTYNTAGQASVATAADRIIISDGSSTRIVDTSSGSLLGSFPTAGQARVITSPGRITMSDANVTRIVDASSGSLIRSYNTAGQASATACCDTVPSPNTAPVLNNSGNPSLTVINEDETNNTGTLVSAIIASGAGGDPITDADFGALEGLAIIAVDNSKGTWQYSTNGRAPWTPFGSPSASSALLLASDANTRIHFMPNLNFNGTVNPGITFRAWDQTSGSNGSITNTTTHGGETAFSTATETARITVNPVNDAPSFSKGANQTVNVNAGMQTVTNWATNILAGPANESGQSLAFNVTNNNPSLFARKPAIAPNGTLTYQPATDATGSAVVTVTLKDNGGTANGGIDTSPPQTFIITVTVITGNKAPVLDNSGHPLLAGIDEDAITNTGTPVSGIIASVLPLDMITDADPGALEGLAIIAVDDDNGAWQFSTNGGSTWMALGNRDLSTSSARLLASDANTRIHFIPNPNFNGTINPGITFHAWDQTSGSNGGTADTTSNGGGTAFSTATEIASITVNPINDAPDAVGDKATTPTNMPRIITVLANDTDPENDPLTVAAVGAPANGTATLNLDNTVTYAPNLSFTGVDVFTYTIGDPGGLTDTAGVTVTVGVVNNAPNAVNDTATTLTGTPVTIAVLNNDADPDGDNLTVIAVSAPTDGIASINGSTVVYTPGASFNGVDSFTYTISDGSLTATATVMVTVAAPGVNLWEEDLFDELALGPLHGQNGWTKASADRASAVVIPEGTGKVLLIDAASGATIVMGKDVPDQDRGRHAFTVRVKVTGPADPAQPSLAKIEVRTNPGGGWDKKFQLYFGAHIRVNYSPSGAATIIVPSTIPNRWYHIRGELDLDQERLDVWVDGNPVASDILMHPGPITDLGLSGWDRPGAVLLDNLIGQKLDDGFGGTPGGASCNLEPVFWIGPAGGRWIDPANWSTNAVPNNQQHAFITLSGNYTVIVDTEFGAGAGCLTLGSGVLQPTLWIKGGTGVNHARLSVVNSFTNDGTLRLESQGESPATTASATLVVGGGGNGSLTNTGVIEVNEGTGGIRIIAGNLVNQGTVNVNYDLAYHGSGFPSLATFTNTGTLNIAAGQKMTVFGPGKVFNQNAGIVAGEGILEISGGAILNFNGGTFIDIAPLVLNFSTLTIAPSATGAISFITTGSKLSGDIHPGQTIRIREVSNSTLQTLTILNDLTNAGTIRLESEGGAFSSRLQILDGTLINTGLIEVNEGSGGDRLIWGKVTNRGLLKVNHDLRFNGLINNVFHPFINLGTVEIAQDKKMVVSGGQTFNQNGGTITGAGVLEVSNTAILNFNGGTVTGSPVFLSNSTLNIAPSATGAASFTMAGGQLRGDIHPDQTVWVRGAGSFNTVTLPNGLTNVGFIRLESEAGNFPSNLTILSGTLTNTGDISVNQGSNSNAGIIRTIQGNIVNQGAINLSLPSTQTLKLTGPGARFENSPGGFIQGTGRIDVSGTTFTNAGKVNPGAPLGELSITGNFPQTSTGALTIDIGGLTPGSQFDQLKVSGQAILSGTLNLCLANGFVPAVGDRFEILTFGSRAGDFAVINGLEIGNSKRFEATYSSDRLTLEVVASINITHTIFLPIITKDSLSVSPPGPCP